MSGQGAHPAVNAVESLSNVNILCLDKTGTLTTNKIALSEVYPIGVSKEEVEQAIGDYGTNTSAPNKTSDACCSAFVGEKRNVADEVPFSSARRVERNRLR